MRRAVVGFLVLGAIAGCSLAPSAELAILRSESHLANLEQLAEFNRVLSRCLDKAAG